MKLSTRVSRLLQAASLLVILLGGTDSIQANEKNKTGLIPLTEQEHKEVKKNWRQVKKPRFNKIGAARVKHHREKKGLAEQIIPVGGFHNEEAPEAEATATAILLPSSVDNSQLPSFPPIGNQGSIGSCVAWASTYYQGTHETGLVNGTNNKVSNKGILSPKWSYNLINGGADQGAGFTSAYGLMSAAGAASIAAFPYDSNYRAWDMNPQDWIDALNYRMGNFSYVTGLSTGNFTPIKTMLANGHVVAIGTYAYGWVTTRVKSSPDTLDKYVGQLAISWLKSKTGSHMVTIVGYDDDIWIDVNGNGQVDPGEKGAFLVANSWGTGWGNSGFVWIAYDAFLSQSAVPGGPNTGRVMAASAGYNFGYAVTPKAAHYTPSLIALFEIEQASRSLIEIHGGASTTSEFTPTIYAINKAFYYAGGNYEFNGSLPTTALPGTFAIDLTDFIQSNQDLQRFYLNISTASSMNYTLNSYSLIDPLHGVTTSYMGSLPQSTNQVIHPYIDYAPNIAPVPQPLTAAISSPVNGETVVGIVPITVEESSALKVDLYVDGQFSQTDTTDPFIMFCDTTKLSNGSHQFMIVATDALNGTVTNMVQVTVQN